MHTRRKIQNFINRQTGKKRVEKNLLPTPLFFITTTWNTCLLPIFPFDQYLSVGIVINPSQQDLVSDRCKKKKKIEESISKNLEIRASNRTEREGIRSYVEARGTNGERRKEKERERETEIENPISWTDKIRLFVHTLRITVGFVDCSASSRSLPPLRSSLSENNDLSGQIGWLGLEV